MADNDTAAETPLTGSAAQTRDAAKYLIATFGAVGAVLVSKLSLTSLPAGREPLLAAVAVAVALVSLALAINLVVDVITPSQVSLGQIAKLEQDAPESELARFLMENDELFQGHGTSLGAFRTKYKNALDERASLQDAYLLDPLNQAKETAARVAAARVEFLYQAVGQLLDVAVYQQLRQTFAKRRVPIAVALALVAAGAGVFAWASAKPSEPAAFLKRADLQGADLSGASLRGADLRGADLTHAVLRGANLTGAKTDDKTVWTGAVCPDGTKSSDAHDSCVGHLTP